MPTGTPSFEDAQRALDSQVPPPAGDDTWAAYGMPGLPLAPTSTSPAAAQPVAPFPPRPALPALSAPTHERRGRRSRTPGRGEEAGAGELIRIKSETEEDKTTLAQNHKIYYNKNEYNKEWVHKIITVNNK